MEAKHTPGPWEAGWGKGVTGPRSLIALYNDKVPMTMVIAPYVDDCSQVVAAVACKDEEANANARLIAAAPELLEALERVTDLYCAIADSGDCGNWNPEDDAPVKAARAAIAKATGGEA